ncbi:MAG: protein kinase [Candidatus Woesearchaeota archaeon]
MNLQELMPNDIEFSKTTIDGVLDSYRFIKSLNTGAQGEVMKYKGVNTGQDVVFKYYKSRADRSTQISEDNMGSYMHNMTEYNYLSLLSVVARVNAYLEKCEKEGVETDASDVDRLMQHAASYNDITEIVKNPSTVAPVVVDRIRYITDQQTGKRYKPFSDQITIMPFDRKAAEHSNKRMEKMAALYSFENGDTLDRILANNLDMDHRERIIKELIHAAMITHSFGIVHRDLKSENIIITEDGNAKFLDFGIARIFTPSDRIAEILSSEEKPVRPSIRYQQAHSLGSRLFSCPEVYSVSHQTDNKEDIFSLGLLGAVILTGEHPFLDSEGNRLTDYLQGDEKTKKKISRNYRTFMELTNTSRRKKRKLEKMYQKFLKRHGNDLLHRIAPMFHPEESLRPNRMSIAGKAAGIEEPSLPACFHIQEIVPWTYKPEQFMSVEERQIVESLNRLNLDIRDYYDFEDAFLGRHAEQH